MTVLRSAPYPVSLFPRGAAARACVDEAPDPKLRLVLAQLVLRPAWEVAQLWDELAPPTWRGNALHVLAARLLAPIEVAQRTLRGQEGHHGTARAQLLQVLELDPDCAEAQVIREALGHLERWEADAAERAEVNRG